MNGDTAMTHSMLQTQARYQTEDSMLEGLSKLNEELDELTPTSEELGRKWEVQTYHRSFHFVMANTTWKHINTLPHYMKIPLVVVPLLLGIGDIFINLFHFTLGNVIKVFINKLASDFLCSGKQPQNVLLSYCLGLES